MSAGSFRYLDLGSAAYISRGRAIVSAGPLRLSGFAGWVIWLFIHITFLTGYRNRAGAILTWWLAFTRDLRRERAYPARNAGVAPYGHEAEVRTPGDSAAAPPRPPAPRPAPRGTAAPQRPSG
jgi:NADH dehydrogenase